MARDKRTSVRRRCNAETRATSASEAKQAGGWFKQKEKERKRNSRSSPPGDRIRRWATAEGDGATGELTNTAN